MFFLNIRNYDHDPGSTRYWMGDNITSTPIEIEGKKIFTLDDQAGIVLKGKPKAWLSVRIRHWPPDSWKKLHPNEFFIDEDGGVSIFPSLASDTFWNAAENYCTAVIKYVESRPWANRVIGYHNTHIAEGVHLPVADGYMFDHNPAMQVKWREFLTAKYKTDKAFQKAYNDKSLSLKTIRVPKDRMRGPAPKVAQILYWQNATENQYLRDYFELQKLLWHKRLKQVAAGMKAGTQRNVPMFHDVFKQSMQW